MKQIPKISWDKGDIILKHFKILQVIQGGMGIIYIVKDLEYSKKDNSRPEIMIAKSIKPELTMIPGFPERFFNEAQLWVNIPPHINILRAYFVDIFLDVPYVFADYIEQHILPNILLGWIYQKITPPEVAIRILLQVIDALSYAYDHNVAFHGDLKPSNILIDKNCIVKVTDWGLSHFEKEPIEVIKIANLNDDSELMASKQIINRGTFGYSAPELINGELNLTKAIDIFSIGVIFGEMLTGKKFSAGISAKKIESELDSIFALDVEKKVAFSKIISKFLDVESDSRIKHFEENIEELKRIFTNMTDFRFMPPSITIEPLNNQWAGQVAYSMMRLNKKALGFEYFKDLLNTKDKDLIICNLNDSKIELVVPQNIIDKYEEELLHDSNNVQKLLFLGGLYSSMKNNYRCKELYNRVLELDNTNEEAINDLISIYEQENNRGKSIELGKKLISMEPQSVSKWINYAKICAKFDMIQEGIDACSKATKYGSLTLENLLIYGDLVFRSSNINKALEIFQMACQIDQKNGLVWYNIATCQYNLLSQNNSLNNEHRDLIQTCILSFQNSIKYNGPGESYLSLAALHMRLYELEEAKECLEQATKMSPNNPKVWFNYGQIMMAEGNFNDAIRYFEISLSINPNYKLAKDSLSRALNKRNI